MQIPNFTYRYNVTVNGRHTSRWFTTRNEARAYRRELSSSNSNDSTYSIIRQSVNWGDSTSVS